MSSQCNNTNPETPQPRRGGIDAASVLLPLELAESVAVMTLRLQAVATLWQDPLAIAQPLNVLPRYISPNLTKAALVQLPHVDLDFASIQLGDVTLLDFMYFWFNNLSDPKARPLQYDCTAQGGVIDRASAKGFVTVLAWWFRHYNTSLFFQWTAAAIDEASANGDLQVLNWWFHESGLQRTELLFSTAAMDQASSNGLDHVLEWWLNSSGLPNHQLRYSEKAMGLAAANEHWTTLHWWMQSGLTLMTHNILDHAASQDRMAVLEWCLVQPVIVDQVRFDSQAAGVDPLIAGAIERGNHALLTWFQGVKYLRHQWDFADQAAASMAAARKGDWPALRWLRSEGWLCGLRSQLVNLAAASGNLQVMTWLHSTIQHGRPVRTWDHASTDGFLFATERGFVSVLDWLLEHGYQPRPNELYYSHASRAGQVEALYWWKAYNGVFRRHDVTDAIACALDCENQAGRFAVLDWWLESGLLTPRAFYESWRNDILETIAKQRDLAMIRWWVERAGPEYKHLLKSVVFAASDQGHLDILTYLHEHCERLSSVDIQEAIAEASYGGQVAVLEWWRTVGGALDSDFDAVISGPMVHDAKAMLWWTQTRAYKEAHLEGIFSSFSMRTPVLSIVCRQSFAALKANVATAQSKIKRLVTLWCEWGQLCHLVYLFRSGAMIGYDAHKALLGASRCDHLPILKWWKHVGLEMVPPTGEEYDALGSLAVKIWWAKTGMLTWV